MKYIAVDISKKMFTTLFIAVPDDFDATWTSPQPNTLDLSTAADETTDSLDWNGDEDNQDLEIERVTEIPESEARQYKCWDSVSGEVMP